MATAADSGRLLTPGSPALTPHILHTQLSPAVPEWGPRTRGAVFSGVLILRVHSGSGNTGSGSDTRVTHYVT